MKIGAILERASVDVDFNTDGFVTDSGSLEAGKDADLVVLSGDPLSVYTTVEQTWVEGRLIYDRSDPEHRRYAIGGRNVYRTTAGGGGGSAPASGERQ